MKRILALGLATVASFGAQAVELFNNGSMFQSGNLSILTAPDTTFGVASNAAATVADNFSVGGNGWNVQSLNFFAYQTSAVGFTFTNVVWSVIAGTNISTGAVVASGTTAVANGGLLGYRVLSSATTGTTRAIYNIAADVSDFSLGAGSYFLTWALAGTSASGPFVAPTVAATGDSLQYTTTTLAWNPILDGGSFRALDLPFAIQGTVVAVPEPATYGLMFAGLLAVAGVARRRKS